MGAHMWFEGGSTPQLSLNLAVWRQFISLFSFCFAAIHLVSHPTAHACKPIRSLSQEHRAPVCRVMPWRR